MSSDHDEPAYSQLAINAWTILSVIVTVGLACMYIFGTHIMHQAQWVWDLLRYLARPII